MVGNAYVAHMARRAGEFGITIGGLVSVDWAHGYIAAGKTLQTSVPGIWALGDCNGRGAFTHTSYNDGEIVAANLLDGAGRSVNDRIAGRSVNDRITAYAVYTDPPLGRAGMAQAEALAAGHRTLAGTIAMEDVSRAYKKSETLGLMKILVDGHSE
jgi:pyruvate/2-oxoglutarate dehydrogenase complex dihydrolipoamide dehydrogenase (E3) component